MHGRFVVVTFFMLVQSTDIKTSDKNCFCELLDCESAVVNSLASFRVLHSPLIVPNLTSVTLSAAQLIFDNFPRVLALSISFYPSC
jgi:hypothetical protein